MLKLVGAVGGAAGISAFLAACGGDDDDDGGNPTATSGGGAAEPTATTASGGGGAEPTATTASGGGDAPTATEASGGGGDLADEQTFRINKERDPLHFDYNKDLYCDGDAAIFAQVGMFNTDYEAVPDVASWEANEDFSKYTYHFREDTAWTNGDPVTAHDYRVLVETPA